MPPLHWSWCVKGTLILQVTTRSTRCNAISRPISNSICKRGQFALRRISGKHFASMPHVDNAAHVACFSPMNACTNRRRLMLVLVALFSMPSIASSSGEPEAALQRLVSGARQMHRRRGRGCCRCKDSNGKDTSRMPGFCGDCSCYYCYSSSDSPTPTSPTTSTAAAATYNYNSTPNMMPLLLPPPPSAASAIV